MRDIDQLVEFYEKVVDRLILQYGEYVFLQSMITKLTRERFVLLAKAAHEKQMRVATVVKSEPTSDLVAIDERKRLYEIDRDRVADEMTFPNPFVWMRYKEKAYKGTGGEIATLGDLRRHCAPPGYICTMRYRFLCEYLRTSGKADLEDRIVFPDQLAISNLYSKEFIVDLCTDAEFLAAWKREEYAIMNNRISKWHSGGVRIWS